MAQLGSPTYFHLYAIYQWCRIGNTHAIFIGQWFAGCLHLPLIHLELLVKLDLIRTEEAEVRLYGGARPVPQRQRCDDRRNSYDDTEGCKCCAQKVTADAAQSSEQCIKQRHGPVLRSRFRR